MLQRIVKQPIQIYRDGKFLTPTVGSVVELTDAEEASIRRANPKALAYPLVSKEPLVALPPGGVASDVTGVVAEKTIEHVAKKSK